MSNIAALALTLAAAAATGKTPVLGDAVAEGAKSVFRQHLAAAKTGAGRPAMAATAGPDTAGPRRLRSVPATIAGKAAGAARRQDRGAETRPSRAKAIGEQHKAGQRNGRGSLAGSGAGGAGGVNRRAGAAPRRYGNAGGPSSGSCVARHKAIAGGGFCQTGGRGRGQRPAPCSGRALRQHRGERAAGRQPGRHAREPRAGSGSGTCGGKNVRHCQAACRCRAGKRLQRRRHPGAACFADAANPGEYPAKTRTSWKRSRAGDDYRQPARNLGEHQKRREPFKRDIDQCRLAGSRQAGRVSRGAGGRGAIRRARQCGQCRGAG